MPTAGDAGATNHDEWMRAEVPGCVHTDLLANGNLAPRAQDAGDI